MKLEDQERNDARRRRGSERGDERGRDAEKPREIPRKGWRDIFKRLQREIARDNLPVVSAGVAFFLLLGLVPGLAALISIYAFIADPAQVQAQFASVAGILPADAARLIGDQLSRIAADSGTAGFGAVISTVLALWGGSAAMKNLMKGLNIAYDEEEKRGTIKRIGIALLLTLAAVVAGVIALGLIAVLPVVLELAGAGKNASLIGNLIRWPFLVALAILGLGLLYRFGPSRAKPKWRWVTWGSVSATIVWAGASALFSFYVSSLGNFNETYGSLGAVVILLLWLYISAFVVLLGAELNAEMEHQTARDTTEEPDKPMGRRGAHVADDLGEAYP